MVVFSTWKTQEIYMRYNYLGTSEELQQKIRGRGLTQEEPTGSCSVTMRKRLNMTQAGLFNQFPLNMPWKRQWAKDSSAASHLAHKNPTCGIDVVAGTVHLATLKRCTESAASLSWSLGNVYPSEILKYHLAEDSKLFLFHNQDQQGDRTPGLLEKSWPHSTSFYLPCFIHIHSGCCDFRNCKVLHMFKCATKKSILFSPSVLNFVPEKKK